MWLRESRSRVVAHHGHNLWVDLLRNDSSLGGDVLEHLVQRLALDALALQVRASVVEVKHDCALLQLSDKQLRSVRGRDLCGKQVRPRARRVQLIQFADLRQSREGGRGDGRPREGVDY